MMMMLVMMMPFPSVVAFCPLDQQQRHTESSQREKMQSTARETNEQHMQQRTTFPSMSALTRWNTTEITQKQKQTYKYRKQPEEKDGKESEKNKNEQHIQQRTAWPALSPDKPKSVTRNGRKVAKRRERKRQTSMNPCMEPQCHNKNKEKKK